MRRERENEKLGALRIGNGYNAFFVAVLLVAIPCSHAVMAGAADGKNAAPPQQSSRSIALPYESTVGGTPVQWYGDYSYRLEPTNETGAIQSYGEQPAPPAFAIDSVAGAYPGLSSAVLYPNSKAIIPPHNIAATLPEATESEAKPIVWDKRKPLEPYPIR